MIDFTDEQKMARKLIRAWAEKELAPLVPRMERGELLPYDTMRKLIRTFGIDEMAKARAGRAAPEATSSGAAGGRSGASEAALMAVLSIELARVCPGFMLAFGATLGLAGGAILARGTERQKQRWALPILTGDKIGAWGMTEPGAGSDAFGGMRTVARRTPDGYVLSGQKTFITNAPFADVFVIYAKIAEASGEDLRTRPIQAFVVDKGAPGLTVGKPMDKMGMHTSPTGEIFLADVPVAHDQLLGEEEKQPNKDGAKGVFHSERTGMAPMCLGIIERCLEDSLKYAKERVTWDRPICEYQLIQDKLARMYVHRENVRNMLFKQLEKDHKGIPIGPAEASATKLYCARAATEVGLEAIQLMGGNGYMREFHVEMLMRDAKLLQIGGGADEIQIVTVARSLIKDGLPD